ncbi:MAG: RNA-binding S4 domain-containing protein [Polyangiaceae bacterium]|nr:RNA-binding S4 domain-containing protein [Polyangiaceae bacterium]
MEEHRVDKWLWCVRVFKTRSDAAEACKNGFVTVNGNDAKPGRDVHTGDTVTVRLHGGLTRTLKIVSLPRSRVAAKELPTLLVDLTPPEEYERARQAALDIFAPRERGAGRPTKRDRRETDKFKEG